MLDEPPSHDLRHDLIGVVDVLAAVKAQLEGERRGEVFGRSGREVFGGLGHAPTIDRERERRKNKKAAEVTRAAGIVNTRLLANILELIIDQLISRTETACLLAEDDEPKVLDFRPES